MARIGAERGVAGEGAGTYGEAGKLIGKGSFLSHGAALSSRSGAASCPTP